jgi:hypothetical protein
MLNSQFCRVQICQQRTSFSFAKSHSPLSFKFKISRLKIYYNRPKYMVLKLIYRNCKSLRSRRCLVTLRYNDGKQRCYATTVKVFSLWSVPVMTSDNNRPTQQSKCFLCGLIIGFITRLNSYRVISYYSVLQYGVMKLLVMKFLVIDLLLVIKSIEKL